MHTLDLLEYLTEIARRTGYEIREEWLNGVGGGGCEMRGKPVLFVDLSLTPAERLEQVADALRCADLTDTYILPEARSLINRAA